MTRFIAILLTLLASCIIAAPVDTTAADFTGAAGTTQKQDSLTQGKSADTSLALKGHHALGATAAFYIGIIPEFVALRSEGENKAIADRMDQNPQDKFDDNEICVPIGVSYRYRLGSNIQFGAGLTFYRVTNSGAWTPKTGDTVYSRKQVNSYALNVLRVSAAARIDIDPLVFTVDNFQRCFFTLEAELLPALFNTERTELGKKLSATGLGYGGSLYAGVERYLNERVSVTGEIGYGLASFSGFDDNGKVLRSDVRKNGSNSAYSIFVRHLSFRFSLFRWF
ncbi:MAG: hypothetical protein V1913_02760 [Fibrobacterota bacterium]